MHIRLLFIISSLPLLLQAQTDVEKNITLRKEYTRLVTECELVNKQAISMKPFLDTYKAEVDSILKGIRFGVLGEERVRLFNYQDSLSCSGMEIAQIVDFYSVMPEHDKVLPVERVNKAIKIAKIRTSTPKVILDSLSLEEENKKLESAIFSLELTLESGEDVIERYHFAKKDRVSLLQELNQVAINHKETLEKVIKFNQELADSMNLWREQCHVGKLPCKLCSSSIGIQDPILKLPPPPPPPPPSYAEEPDKIHAFVDEPAEFIGNLKEYIAANLVYPERAKAEGIEGKCYLQFIVSAKGNISNVEVKRGVPNCPECDVEARRMVKNMPPWKPGKIGGKPVNSTFSIPVSFKLTVPVEQK